MLRTTKNMKDKYEKIQSCLFELIPEKLTIEKKRNIIINYIEGEKKYGN